MRIILVIGFSLVLFACRAKKKKQIPEEQFNFMHTVVVNRADSSIVKKTQWVHFAHSVCVVFPAEYGLKKYKDDIWWKKRTFFTPDTFLIKRADAEIYKQYCATSRRFQEKTWRETVEFLKGTEYERSAKKNRRKDLLGHKKFCRAEKKEFPFMDRQYLSYINQAGEHIIRIQLLDFRQDPYRLKSIFGVSWIEGWHGWFETNTSSLHYHVEKNLLTINEDL